MPYFRASAVTDLETRDDLAFVTFLANSMDSILSKSTGDNSETLSRSVLRLVRRVTTAIDTALDQLLFASK